MPSPLQVIRRRSRKSLIPIFTLITLFASAVVPVTAAEHRIRPGDDPQAALDAAMPGDKLTFLPGLHQHGLGRHAAILYVDKSVDIDAKLRGKAEQPSEDQCYALTTAALGSKESNPE